MALMQVYVLSGRGLLERSGGKWAGARDSERLHRLAAPRLGGDLNGASLIWARNAFEQLIAGHCKEDFCCWQWAGTFHLSW